MMLAPWDIVLAHTRDVPDFPQPGVVFKDVNPLFADAVAFGAVISVIAARHRGEIDLVCGIEARGFVLAAPLAQKLGVGFVPVRKAGKLPGAVLAQDYELEYGSATLEVQPDAVSGARVLLVDDVLATGGTAAAAVQLLQRAQATVVGLDVLIELTFLSGADRVHRSSGAEVPVHAVATV